ncbi:uncharacterized protein LOC114524653 isoform X1 [Dendronephthya gigantea]|uniref:uncharacterized protein LOC114524653 isoform X1 n=1 Tax=Dendronephthya gigantea TaxID=151771 RepID=UPI00106D14DA|nr:uncharacterized protein LOC114524653 isoform X1 [Dendronephthya gigantea]
MMSPGTVSFIAVIYCSIIAYCRGDITAYVKEHLTKEACLSVPQLPDVCNIHWQIRQSDARIYDVMIASINTTISSKFLYEGLSVSDAMHCKKMYENMMCRNTFPVCDVKRMVIDHGDASVRCKLAKEACTTISIEGCGYDSNGQEELVTEQNKCENITVNTEKLCPNTNVKVPKRYNGFIAKTNVERLAKIADKFAKELRNHSIMARCEMKYREVLCRLIDACSPDSLYYLQYINDKDCEEMVACVKSAGFSEEITSVCSTVLSTEDKEEISVRNPYVQEGKTRSSTTATPKTASDSPSGSQAKEKTEASSEEIARSSATATPKTVSDSPSGRQATEKTEETLIEPTQKDESILNNTISKVKNHNRNSGTAFKIYKTQYLFTVLFTLLISLA